MKAKKNFSSDLNIARRALPTPPWSFFARPHVTLRISISLAFNCRRKSFIIDSLCSVARIEIYVERDVRFLSPLSRIKSCYWGPRGRCGKASGNLASTFAVFLENIPLPPPPAINDAEINFVIGKHRARSGPRDCVLILIKSKFCEKRNWEIVLAIKKRKRYTRRKSDNWSVENSTEKIFCRLKQRAFQTFDFQLFLWV